MTLVEAEPTSRFDNVAFSNEVEDGRSLPMNARYTCPHCGEVIGFTKQHFEERAARRHSNLSETVAKRINEWATKKGFSKEPFLDWSCPGCQLSVRAYVQHWAGGKHGDYGAKIVGVVEIASGKSNAP
jgi:rubredoxin